MSNPVMSRNPYFQAGARPNQFGSAQTQYQTDYRQTYAAPGYQQTQQPFNSQQAMFAEQAAAQAAYGGSAFTPAAADSGLMTYRDAMNRTGALLATTVIAGVLTVLLLGVNPGSMMAVALIATIAAFVVGMVIAFKRMVSPGLAISYAALEGVALGGITGAIDMSYPGVAMQAILGTVAVVAVTLGLHYSDKVRTSAKGMKYVLIVAFAGILFGLVNMVIMAFGGPNVYFANPAIGIGLGVIMIFVAAYMLIADFESVQYAVANGAPKKFAWTCAIGIVMTILWIYLEVLRIVAILAADNR